MTPAEPLRVVLFREGDFWLAQGLERDIGVQADNLKDVVTRLALALGAEPDQARLTAAPKYFRDLWPARAGDFLPAESLRALLPADGAVLFAIVA